VLLGRHLRRTLVLAIGVRTSVSGGRE
jgi:hypothetical protein